MANEFLTVKEHCQCVLNWLLRLAYVDGTFSSEEQQLVKGFAATLNIEYAEKKEALELYTVEELMERAEKSRQQITDGQFKPNEEVFKHLLN